ncbi:hypothetical protein [Microvirga massiliensis]|nr:hypothetical protein [Microvirga massiliensis]
MPQSAQLAPSQNAPSFRTAFIGFMSSLAAITVAMVMLGSL